MVSEQEDKQAPLHPRDNRHRWPKQYEFYQKLFKSLEELGRKPKENDPDYEKQIYALHCEAYDFACNNAELRGRNNWVLFDSDAEYCFFKWLNDQTAKYKGISVQAQVPWSCILEWKGLQDLGDDDKKNFNRDVKHRRCDFLLIDCNGIKPEIRLVIELNGPYHRKAGEYDRLNNDEDKWLLVADEKRQQYRRDIIEEYLFRCCFHLNYLTVDECWWEKEKTAVWSKIKKEAGLVRNDDSLEKQTGN